MPQGLLSVSYGTKASYDAIAVKDYDTLYFITDAGIIFRGNERYGGGVLPVAALPITPAQGILYILETTGIGQIWTGSQWQVVTKPILEAMPGTPNHDSTLTSKAISTYVTDAIAGVTGGTGVFVTDVDFIPSTGKLEISKGTQTDQVELTGLAKNPSYEASTRTITIPVVGNPDLIIALGRDLVVTAGKFNAPTNELWLSLAADGSFTDPDKVIKIPVAELIDIYTGKTTNSATVTVSADNEISVDVRRSADSGNALAEHADGLFVPTVDISGKADKVGTGHTGEVLTADAYGNMEASGVSIGGGTMSATPNSNTVATEAGVQAAITAIKTTLENSLNDRITQSIINDANKIPSSAAVFSALSWQTF